MKKLPVEIIERPELNFRQGIKSSLSGIRSVVALLYVFYISNDKKASIAYTEEFLDAGVTKIKIESTLLSKIIAYNSDITEEIINKVPLFTSQMEALQVGVELFLRLGKVEFANSRPDSSERTGGNRYNKIIKFGTNIKLIDIFLSSYNIDLSTNFINSWLNNEKSDSPDIDFALEQILTIFSEETKFKIRTNTGEVEFQQEGIYKELIIGNSVESTDTHELVGPFRIFKSYVREGIHPYISDDRNNGFVPRSGDINLSEYANLVSNGLDLIPKRTTVVQIEKEKVDPIIDIANIEYDNNKIFYGAPGTGKSHIINETTNGESIIRTTFHPDSDYSTFVGCYKPTMKSSVENPISITDLKKRLFEIKLKGEAYPCQRFAAQYWNSLLDLSSKDVKEILADCGFTENFSVEIAKGISVGKEMATSNDDRIVYEFVEQAFLQAYIQAWKYYANASVESEPQKQYLVIEEINRGNCAQIFGDLFQLLDRNKYGFSDYPIQADNDMKKHLSKAFKESLIAQKEIINDYYKGKDIISQVLNGDILLLPNNLYIWATMNTSDQSLFPIDSAFKRRWNWHYMPISKGRDEHGNELDWRICVDAEEYEWWSFLNKINDKIGSTPGAEEKKLGFFFCKAIDGCIRAETFVGKVIFYLWNDVFKDSNFDGIIFEDVDGTTLSFDKFYSTDSNGRAVVQKDKVQLFLRKLGVDVISKESEEKEA